MLAEDVKAWAAHVLAGAAPFALPVAQRGEDDDLVSRLPRGIARLVDDSGAIARDDAGRRDALCAMRQPEVEVVDGCGANGHSDRTRAGRRARPLADPDPCRSDRFFVHRRPALAQDGVLERLRGHDFRNLTNPPPHVPRGEATL